MAKNVLFPQVNKLLHGGDYNPEQWLDCPEILTKDIEMMKKAHVNVVTLGVFSWSMYEPEEGIYNSKWLKDIVDRLYNNGIYFILATPSGARPAWMDIKYPEVLRTSSKKIKNTHGLRHNHCITSPKYRELVKNMDIRLAEEFGNHPGLLMWHISNELGGECCCSLCENKFRKWLENKYHGDIDLLNKAWWTTFWSHRFNNFDQIDIPYSQGEKSIMGLNLDWKRFNTDNTIDFMNSEISVFRDKTPNIKITTNFMHSYSALDYNKMAKPLDVVSWDSYPYYNNNFEKLSDTFFQNAYDHICMRSFKKDRPFILMESVPDLVNWHEYNHSKRPGVHFLSGMQSIACGSDSVMYFQWRKSRGSFEQFHGAVVGHLGRDDTRVFKDVAELGKSLELIAEVAGSVTKSEVAILQEWDNRWAIDDAAAFSKKTKKYIETINSYLNLCMQNGVEADIISSVESFVGYKLIITPMLYLLEPGVSERLKQFTADGGVILATYMTGYVNENCLAYLGGFPGDGLTELFGLYVEEIDTLYPKQFNSMNFCNSDDKYKITDYCEVIKLLDAEIEAVYGSDFYKGEPSATSHKYKKGCAYYLGARCEKSGQNEFLKKIFKNAGIKCKNIPEGVEYHRRCSDTCDYDFYLNYNEYEVDITISKGYSLLEEKEVEGIYHLKGLGVLICRVQH